MLIGLVALLVLPLASLPVHFLARLASLLYLLVLMGVNLTLFRRQQPETSTFALPFHPWVPGLTLAVDVLVGLLWGPVYLAWAATCLVIGTLIYLLYARGHHIEAQEGVIVFKPPPEERAETEYRVLVPSPTRLRPARSYAWRVCWLANRQAKCWPCRSWSCPTRCLWKKGATKQKPAGHCWNGL